MPAEENYNGFCEDLRGISHCSVWYSVHMEEYYIEGSLSLFQRGFFERSKNPLWTPRKSFKGESFASLHIPLKYPPEREMVIFKFRFPPRGESESYRSLSALSRRGRSAGVERFSFDLPSIYRRRRSAVASPLIFWVCF